MKAFEEHLKKVIKKRRSITWAEECMGKEFWIAALKHFNKMYLDGVHPYDVIIEMQKELENE